MIRIHARLPLNAFDLNVSIELKKPVTALCGPSGGGKTSLLKVIAGLHQPIEGEITINGNVLLSSTEKVSLPPEQRRVGYVPQESLLFPHMSVYRNLCYGLKKHEKGISIDSVVTKLEIKHLLDRNPMTLSGGESQRVALGRALVSTPQLLLLDEPLGAIDAGLKDRILPYLRRIREHYDIPTLIVSHDFFEVINLCDEVVLLKKGEVVGQGTPQEVLAISGPGKELLSGHFENIIDVKVTAQEPKEGITHVESTQGLTLVIPHRPDDIGTRLLVGLHGEDILLSRELPVGLSARNVFSGKVEAITESEGIATVRVSTPEPLHVKLTRSAVRQLELKAETPVHLIVKTHSIQHLTERN